MRVKLVSYLAYEKEYLGMTDDDVRDLVRIDMRTLDDPDNLGSLLFNTIEIPDNSPCTDPLYHPESFVVISNPLKKDKK